MILGYAGWGWQRVYTRDKGWHYVRAEFWWVRCEIAA